MSPIVWSGWQFRAPRPAPWREPLAGRVLVKLGALDLLATNNLDAVVVVELGELVDVFPKGCGVNRGEADDFTGGPWWSRVVRFAYSDAVHGWASLVVLGAGMAAWGCAGGVVVAAAAGTAAFVIGLCELVGVFL